MHKHIDGRSLCEYFIHYPISHFVLSNFCFNIFFIAGCFVKLTFRSYGAVYFILIGFLCVPKFERIKYQLVQVKILGMLLVTLRLNFSIAFFFCPKTIRTKKQLTESLPSELSELIIAYDIYRSIHSKLVPSSQKFKRTLNFFS